MASAVASTFNRRLKTAYNRQLSVSGSGSVEKRRNPPPSDSETGAFQEEAAKPPAWLVGVEYDGRQLQVLPLPGNFRNRITNSFNARIERLQGVLARVLPVLRDNTSGTRFVRHPYWEWTLAFVFPDVPTFFGKGSTGQTLDFDPTTGMLSATVAGGTVYEQPYVYAALVGLVDPSEPWSATVQITYGEMSEAIGRYVKVAPLQPDAPQAATDVSEEGAP